MKRWQKEKPKPHWDASGNRHSKLAIMNKAHRSELIAAAREIGTLESANHHREVKSQELASITAWLANQSVCWFCSFAALSRPLWQLNLHCREQKKKIFFFSTSLNFPASPDNDSAYGSGQKPREWARAATWECECSQRRSVHLNPWTLQALRKQKRNQVIKVER